QHKCTIALQGPRGACLPKKALVRGLIEDFAQRGADDVPGILEKLISSVPPCLRGELVFQSTRSPDPPITRFPHSASSAYAVATNGASCVAACLRPEITLIHCTADSITITLTSTISRPQTAASRRPFKMRL